MLHEEPTERDVLPPRLRQSIPTEQLLSNYREALDQHSIVAITDKAGKIQFANDAFCAISQYSRGELVGSDHRLVNSGLHPKSFFLDMWSTLARGETWRGDIRNRAKDGSYYWVRTTIVPFKDTEGRVFQHVAIRTDITENVLMGEKLRRANRRLSQLADELKSEKVALNNKNIALNELISHIEQEKTQIKATMAANLETVIFPLLETMRGTARTLDRKFLDLTVSSLKEISAPFTRGNKAVSESLTPKELQICNMIKNGLAVKEIAEMIHLSPRTIDKHRENIRKKLGLTSRKINLATYLLNQSSAD